MSAAGEVAATISEGRETGEVKEIDQATLDALEDYEKDEGKEESDSSGESSETDSESESSTDEEADAELLATQEAGVKVGIIDAPIPRWEGNAASALRRVAKGLRYQAKGYEKMAMCVDKTPIEIMGPWLKKNLPASATRQPLPGPSKSSADPQPGPSKRARISSDEEGDVKYEEVGKATEREEDDSDGDEGEAPLVHFVKKFRHYKCAYSGCSVVKVGIDAVKAHVREVHLHKAPIKCTYCDQFSSYTRAAVKRHIKNKHAK